ncbi:uncharacterized protein M421DRAFT_395796 [Didymella exigua CBS 183.55]|uniref:G-protein coupled receptors family 1 profile domain-containing protein n=1 Tax=Didymella exigua CBS 183.55 TaxID=1150837 RepID=A0A6A5RZ39_9PLEO|nr:uncharacterized protein M421DRAFT_395796 [Didymella exigua CBS 183.55]KAF1933671.1 hypothetical protein M421DRAFT_395796 [Didymella exigua CBS 183.55]
MSMLSISVLAGILVTNTSGYRIRQIDRKQVQNLCFTQVLMFLLCLISMCFVLSAAVVKGGLGLVSLSACRGAVFLCLSFYILSKIIMYFFLIERAHALRAPFKKRFHDWIWVVGFLLTVSGFGSIGVVALWRPIADMSAIDGRCRIGIPRYTTISLVSYDVGLNILLTLVFVYLLSPLILSEKHPAKRFSASHLTICFGNMCSRSKPRSSLIQANQTNQQTMKRMERLLLRTFLGSILVILPTVGNFVALSVLEGRELGWVCLTACTIDVVWTVSVFHWLTIGSTGSREKPSAE